MYKFLFFDLWPYFIISIIFILCYTYKIKNSSLILYYTLLIFCILRFNIGWDYITYVEEIKAGPVSILESRFEPLSKLVFLISAFLNFYPLTFIFFGWITLLLIYKSINKNSITPTISWLVYYSLPLFFFASLSTIRQSIATALLLYSYEYLKEKKDIKFILTISVATLFHISGLIGLLFWIIVKYPLNKKYNIILFIFPLFANNIIINIIERAFLENGFFSALSWYLKAENEGTSKLQYLYYILGIINLFFYDKLIRLDKSNRIMISFVTFGVFIFNVLSFEPISATRISAFFLIFLMYLIPYYSKIFPNARKIIEQSLVLILIAISFFYLWIYIDTYIKNESVKISFIPYEFWFYNL